MFSQEGHSPKDHSNTDKSVFVMMPFRPSLDEVYRLVVKPTVERATGFQCFRGDDLYGPRAIMADIWRAIRRSELVLADLTDRNPNVFYELGLAHAVGKAVILIAQCMDDVPFDLRHLRVVLYANTEAGRKKLASDLWDTVGVVSRDIASPGGGDHYRVLEPAIMTREIVTGRTDTLGTLRSGDPSEVLSALHEVAAEYKGKKKPTGCDPRILAAITPLLQSEYPDICLAAVRAVRSAGDEIHASALYTVLEGDNPVILRETLSALGDLEDRASVRRLMTMYTNPKYSAFKIDILNSLGSLDYSAAPILSDVAHDCGASESERNAAIYQLGRAQAAEELLAFSSEKVREMSVWLRGTLAVALGGIPVHLQVHANKLQELLEALLADPSPKVRAEALGAWCWQSLPGCRLSRHILWKRLEQETADMVEQFAASVGKGQPFLSEEVPFLLELVSRHPVASDHLSFFLKDIGDETVANVVFQAYLSDAESVWPYEFFSRLPADGTRRFLVDETTTGSDNARKVLAALGLLRLGATEAIDIISACVDRTFPWIKDQVTTQLEAWLHSNPAHQNRQSAAKLLARLRLKKSRSAPRPRRP